ncbi:Telomerase reverse transcriptase [Gnomoniopsis smithogilvyi]|uniref:Telomerase reverse transcriptase n=1 Tax=Gnomoniopsis smithogilvyi TaxID=1191159 RepID=A0A9W8YZF1_9PEZI|nr:Telomerase reverse transcriptase [Gnomoniopsis smithogilvyi]
MPQAHVRNPLSKKRKPRRNASSGGSDHGQPPLKKPRTGPSSGRLQAPGAVKHPLLAQYYPTTITLRQYLLDNLPAASRLRRKKIAAFGSEPFIADDPDGVRAQLARLLDTTLLGLCVPPKELAKAQSEKRRQQWIDYSQRDDSHVTISGSDASAIHFQSEIVGFVIWLLFSRGKVSSKPQHLLCDGFRRGTGQQAAPCSIQGLCSLYFNERVAILKHAPWPQLLHILGKSGESMMINLLMDCSIFLPVEAGQGNYYQLSGKPIFECEPISTHNEVHTVNEPATFERKPSDIVFVRSRMLYARAALNARGFVHFGLRHIHALNRFPVLKKDSESADVRNHQNHAHSITNNALRIMMYIFPRQFGLHNAFTSHVDPTKTAQKFQDYTLREEEIFAKFSANCAESSQRLDVRVPKRLRGKAEHLVQRLQTFHARCSYAKLMEHHCPIVEIDWLEPPSLKGRKCSQTDFRKRSEIFSEFVYYVFDSLLIPLIRSNFYVTESNVHRYRVYFFRQDVWRSVAEPAMAELKDTMFEEMKLDQALNVLDSRRLGYSQVRLLPKQSSVRPIMNLRRRMVTSKDKKVLGHSINTILSPVYNMLKFEKDTHAERLGSTMFSVGDLYGRLSSFKERLGAVHGPLYFAKVDVQAAFDTIPQDAVIALMNSVPSESKYEMIKHVEVVLNENAMLPNTKTLKRWHTSAKAPGDTATFLEHLGRQIAPVKKNTVYVDSVFRKTHRTRDLLALMASHIQQSLVKIGKKYYRQKAGIPQGSVISSVLCNYFYADLEQTQLSFLRADDCLLLRLIDDFLLVTPDQSKAARFIAAMQQGFSEYGVTVSPAKTLVNFPLTIGNLPVPALPPGATVFPYCGTQIHVHTLNLTKDRGLANLAALKDPTISNALTVEFSRHPGANFKRKTLNAFKIQSHLMFFDARHNSSQTVVRNLRDALVETATKSWAYARCLPAAKRPSAKIWVETLQDLVEVVHLLLNSRARKLRFPRYESSVTKAQARWLVFGAFRGVLGRKQANFGEVLQWLDGEMGRLEGKVVGNGRGKDVKALV